MSFPTTSTKSRTKTRINEAIRVPEVRLIGDDGEQLGIGSLEWALSRAKKESLDLVEISPTAQPPVCRLMNYGKFIFEQRKKQQAAKKSQKQTQVKEIKLRPGTDVGDFTVKMRQIRGFLEENCKVKVTIRFRGREMSHQELGDETVKKVLDAVQDIAHSEQIPKLEGRQVVFILSATKRQ